MDDKKKKELAIRSSAAEYLTFVASTGESDARYEMRYEDENIWLTQKMMAGAVGGGGLGDFAIRYGHSRGQTDVTYATVIIILIMVSLIQSTGSYVIKKTTH